MSCCEDDFDLYVGAVVPWEIQVMDRGSPSAPFDLTGYTMTVVIVKPSGEGVTVGLLTPTSPATSGIVTYQPAADFVDEPGDYVVYVDGDDGAGHVVTSCEAVVRVGQRRVPTA